MEVMPQMSQPLVTSQTGTTVLPQIKEKKPTYKSIMADLLKPPPKDDKPNIHLGGGQFTKLEKI
jgi:hypothetical protein